MPGPSSPTPYPPAQEVEDFHTNSDLNARKESQHHSLGSGEYQASPGPHNHRGGDSVLLLSGVTLTGSRGGNVALVSIIQALVALGATDSTSP